MNKTRRALWTLLASSAVAAGLGELSWRWLREGAEAYQMHFRDSERKPYWPERASREEQVAFHIRIQRFVEAPMPRSGVPEWLPGARFFLCYTGPRQPYFDADGCVEYRFNELGLRDRPGLTWDKPAGTTRVLCLGDSFTLGWGVRQEHNWPVLVEQELGKRWPYVQLVNAGGAGSSYADEYAAALVHRFGRLQPDVVLVTLCLNDLLVTNGKLCQYRDEALAPAGTVLGSALLGDLVHLARTQRALDLDPEDDVVPKLLGLPADDPAFTSKNETPAIYWQGDAPQQALRTIRDWCRANGAKPAVVLWPFLQGLGPGRHYPFVTMHRLVEEFCASEQLPLLDLLPVLADVPAESLWVSPVDMHPNERAQQLVTPVLSAFVADTAGLGR